MMMGTEAMKVALALAAPLLLVALVTGLIISILQAATQINEQTLSFLPRLLVMLITLVVLGPWLVTQLMEFTERLIHNIPQLIG